MGSTDQYCALVVEDLAASATMMLSTKCRELFTTMKAVFRVLIPHPKLLAQKLAA
jgi:hypothetical protein